jgi:hypothetical protein
MLALKAIYKQKIKRYQFFQLLGYGLVASKTNCLIINHMKYNFQKTLKNHFIYKITKKEKK